MGKEHQRLAALEIAPELVQAYIQVFLSRWDCYPFQQPNGKYFRVKQPLTASLVEAHLQGNITLGTYALDPSNHAKWMCLDADEEMQWQKLKEMTKDLYQQGIPLYLETSRRGGHAWFFTIPIPGNIIRRFGKALIQKYELGKIELYPKQDQLNGGVGSLVRLPLGVHQKTGKRYSYITPDDQPLAPTIREQLAVLAAPQLVSQETITDISAAYREPTTALLHPTRRLEIHLTGQGPLSERLKRAVSVREFVSQYVELDHRNKGLCPFHEDHIQSFQVDDQRNYWHCYAGCGGGSIIDFQIKWRQSHGQDSSFKATLKELADMLL